MKHMYSAFHGFSPSSCWNDAIFPVPCLAHLISTVRPLTRPSPAPPPISFVKTPSIFASMPAPSQTRWMNCSPTIPTLLLYSVAMSFHSLSAQIFFSSSFAFCSATSAIRTFFTEAIAGLFWFVWVCFKSCVFGGCVRGVW